MRNKTSKTFARRFAAICMTLVMIFTMVPATAVYVNAAATNISISNAEYYDSGAVKKLDANFGWDTAAAPGRLVLMTEELTCALKEIGPYGKMFSTFDAAKAHDSANGTFGIISDSDEKGIVAGTNSFVFNFNDTDIPLQVNKAYYVYLWTYYESYYYPDYLIAKIQVQDGTVKYQAAGGSTFEDVVSAAKYDVTVKPADNMTKVSGEEAQTDLGSAMAPVVYDAAAGYYFPEDYTVASVNGIKVSRVSESQIKVYGTPTADTEISLTAPTKKVEKELEEVVFKYAYDVQRDPAYPAKGDTVTVSGFAPPYVNGGTQASTSAGTWTLTKVGRYAAVKGTANDNANLSSLVTSTVSAYNDKGIVISADNVVIHELKDGDTHIAFGIVVAYDKANEYAIFIGDALSGSAGYFLSTAEHSGRVQANVTEDLTDYAAETYKVTVADAVNGVVTASVSEAEEGEDVVITATPAAGYAVAAITVTDAEDNAVTVTDGKFTMPASDVTVTVEFTAVNSGAEDDAVQEPEEEPVTEEPSEEEPQTGDNFNALNIALIALAALIVASRAFTGRRRVEK